MERVRKVPPIIRELKTAGFDVRIRRHQNNDVFISAMVDAIRSVPFRGRIQISTQEGLQYPPSTIYEARLGEYRYLCAVSEVTEPLHTINEIFITPPSTDDMQAKSV